MGGPITREELESAIAARPKGRAPGSDDVAYEHISVAWKCNGRWAAALRTLITAILQFQYFPSYTSILAITRLVEGVLRKKKKKKKKKKKTE
ncbi:hypothetical protein Pmar_PMAR018204 [Perkinsus marinus ATCC 50983]|uniref:Uncharacterized protein n=1 Tax=Perkinsus marinus (strain ATCC 50983 / TXsc) TaxID=423536 RepID=C5KZ54_PERM5|nr:hypothetical protein Pmar_PMAR018204 [Perkinsus marinus ATCC 50983]EER10203.1 hypothetical protein Pmar_PMAR018204 [Perkinsus marinus ATCC 50983]|eukprot:XP_002778408.1 hypothetical protein Pmar_PMAR018204 [Perkinsus marinus ATCC 50983]